ncbi:MAG: AmmeMemoRadiSam system protein A [Candidatus Woesearchaeota archaeon]|jgi:AmmeMemoRadiSam system protein A
MTLTKIQGEELLKIARDSINLHLENKTYLKINTPENWMKEQRATFVTLKLKGKLRGCIGHLYPIQPTYKDIIDNAVAAAFFDPRFNELTKHELDHVTIEISILTPPEKLEYSSPEDLLKKLKPDMGITISDGISSSTFLPQVWEEIKSKEEFMNELCIKASLPSDAWKGPIKIQFYKVEAYSEKK